MRPELWYFILGGIAVLAGLAFLAWLMRGGHKASLVITTERPAYLRGERIQGRAQVMFRRAVTCTGVNATLQRVEKRYDEERKSSRTSFTTESRQSKRHERVYQPGERVTFGFSLTAPPYNIVDGVFNIGRILFSDERIESVHYQVHVELEVDGFNIVSTTPVDIAG